MREQESAESIGCASESELQHSSTYAVLPSETAINRIIQASRENSTKIEQMN